MADNRQQIYAKVTEINQEGVAVNAAASLFHPEDARAHVDAIRTKADELDALLDELTFVPGGQLQIAPFPSPMTAVQGQPFSYQFVATGGAPPYTFTWSGITPAGMTLSTDGLMSGTMEQFPGSYTIFVRVIDSQVSIYSVALWLVVTAP